MVLDKTKRQQLKITRFLDLFRAETGDLRRARVESLNFVPTAAGLASSASAFAALAGAMNEATGLHLPAQQLSTYARRGSGSATRSLFGGFVEWNKGDSNENSMAIPVDDANFDIGMIIIVVSAAEKKNFQSCRHGTDRFDFTILRRLGHFSRD